jgi:uncharacterized protein
MKIDINAIRFDVGAVQQVDGTVKMDDLVLRDRTVELPEPLHLNLTVTNTDDTYLIMGMMSLCARVECSRCLEKSAFPMEMEFFEEFSKDEMENENLLDLTDSIFEHILLELPIKTLCSEECKGLCPQCGQNINLQDCGCDRSVIDPRLVKLQEFFKKD